MAAELKRSVPRATAMEHRGAAASLAVRAAAAQGAYDETLAELEAQVRILHQCSVCLCVMCESSTSAIVQLR
jgi:bacterioferritin-associated ferredoxin